MRIDLRTIFLMAAALLTIAGPTPSAQAQVQQQDPLYQWCDDTLRILHRAKERAEQDSNMGDAERAKYDLVTGLQDALSTGSLARHSGLLTARAIERGIDLSAQMTQTMFGQEQGTRTLVYFLFDYYEFIRQTADELDRTFTIPNHNCRLDCHNTDGRAYEENFIRYTSRQLSLVLGSLIVRRDSGDFAPIGATKGYLSALATVTGYVSRDLRESLWNKEYACQIGEITELSNDLSSYLRGGHNYSGDYEAVQSSYFQASRLAAEITPDGGCFRHRDW